MHGGTIGTKKQIRQLKTALRWKIPTGQRARIQMVLLRESGMTRPRLRRRWAFVEHREPRPDGL
jgi:hypothetical protein